MTVTDEMVETAWAAIVGGDIAKNCFTACIVRADLKTGLDAAISGCGDPNCKDPDCTYGKGPNTLLSSAQPASPLRRREPDAWQWRACIFGIWGRWKPMEQPVKDFEESNKYNLENGTYELRRLYASPPEQPTESNPPSFDGTTYGDPEQPAAKETP